MVPLHCTHIVRYRHSIQQKEECLTQSEMKMLTVPLPVQITFNAAESQWVHKVLARASQESNSLYFSSFEWCDYVWRGTW